MKKIKVFLLVMVALLLSAYMLPPQLPSSYYGEVVNGQVGQVISTNLNGSTNTFAYGNQIVYTLNVTGGVEGQEVVFFVDGTQAGTGIYHVGGNQNLDLFVPLPVLIPPVIRLRPAPILPIIPPRLIPPREIIRR